MFKTKTPRVQYKSKFFDELVIIYKELNQTNIVSHVQDVIPIPSNVSKASPSKMKMGGHYVCRTRIVRVSIHLPSQLEFVLRALREAGLVDRSTVGTAGPIISLGTSTQEGRRKNKHNKNNGRIQPCSLSTVNGMKYLNT